MTDTFANIDAVAGFSTQIQEGEALDHVTESEVRAGQKLRSKLARLALQQTSLKHLFVCFLLALAAERTVSGALPVGQVAMVIQLGLLFTAQIECLSLRLVSSVDAYGQMDTALKEAFPPEPNDEGTEATPDGSISIRGLSLIIGGRNLFQNADLKIEAGAFVRLFGDSGSGKSTLFRILLGSERRYTGAVCLGPGAEARQFSRKTLLASVVALRQNGQLFNRSLQENVVYGTLRGEQSEHTHTRLKTVGLSHLSESLS